MFGEGEDDQKALPNLGHIAITYAVEHVTGAVKIAFSGKHPTGTVLALMPVGTGS